MVKLSQSETRNREGRGRKKSQVTDRGVLLPVLPERTQGRGQQSADESL